MRCCFLFLLFYVFAWLPETIAQNEFKVAIEVRDKRSQKPILAIVSVVGIGSESELKGKMMNEKYVIQVKPERQYRIFAALQEYKTYRQTHVFENNSTNSDGSPQLFIVELEPLGSAKNEPVAMGLPQVIKIIDRKQKLVLSQAMVRLKAVGSNEVIVPTKAANGTWLADLKAAESYTIEVSAPNYEPHKDVIKSTVNEVIEISLNRVAQHKLSLQAVDALTGKPVAARFKLTDGVRETYSGMTNAGGSVYEMVLPPKPQNYDLTTNATGYRTQQTKVAIGTQQDRLVVKLSKADVVLKLNIRDAQTLNPLAANVRIIDQNDKKVILNLKNAPKGEASATINPDHHYVLEVEHKGFMSYQQPLEQALPQLETENSLLIKLNQMGDAFASLSAIDGTTGKRIAATFKVSAGTDTDPTQSKTTENALVSKFKISEPAIFSIETTALGYRVHKGELDAEEFGAGKVFTYEAVLTAEPKKIAEVKPATPEPPTTVEVEKVEEKKILTTAIFHFRATDGFNKKVVYSARFKVVNAANRQPVAGKGNASDYQAELQLSQGYLLEIEANGYEKSISKIEPAAAQATLKREITLTKKTTASKSRKAVNEKVFENAKLGEAVTIEDNVYFDQSSYILRPEAHSQLNQLVGLMAKNAKLKVQIAGFTDNVGDPRLNLILSENRAKVIANYLANKGIAESRITHLGYGQTKPITANDSEDNKRKNRRVEFIIKDN